MATVHRAIERGIEGFERVVALKRLLPHLAEDEGFVRAFVREAKLASMLQHGNIVQLYELGRVGPSYFISMEYIPGRDLRVILRQARRVCGPPPVEIALAVLTELLDALDYAHSQCGADGTPLGLVHRDISPSNLLVSHTGHLKVIDFGIAKATLGHLMTHTGRIKGKLSYMAPEALSGRTLDGRSDLFSASVIAHELLTATPLFAAKDDFQTIDKLQNMLPPPPSARNPSCPPELDAIVLRGLAKDPTQRWRSASEMRAALADFAIDQHRLATNREVCDWVEEAFEMPLPSRMRLPAGPSAADVRRGGAAAAEADDEVLDIVWGVTGPRSPMAVVLEEVPDVSSRFSRSSPESLDLEESPEPPDLSEEIGERDPFEPLDPLDPLSSDAFASSLALAGEDEPTNAMARPTLDPPGPVEPIAATQAARDREARITYRTSPSQVVSLASVAAEADAASHSASGLRRSAARPAEWALGTSPTSQQPHHELLEQALEAARRASPAVTAASTTFPLKGGPGKPSLMPLLIASVAVAAAGAAIAWIVSGGDGGEATQVAAAVPPPAHVQPLQQDGQGAMVPPERAQAPAAGFDPAEAAIDGEYGAGAVDSAESPDDAIGRSRALVPRKRRSRLRADEGLGRGRELAGLPAADGERAVAASESADQPQASEGEAGEAGAADPGPLGAEQVVDAARQPASKESSRPGGGEPPRQPAVTAEPPARTRPLAPARPRGPIIVPPNRTRREAGSVPPIQFPRWETAPKQITAKLCIDARGRVTSVSVMSPVSANVRATVERALSQWQYRPVVEDDEKVAACFATTFRVEVK